MQKKIVTEKLVESFQSMKPWFVDGERNRLKSAINLPLKAKREDCLVEGANYFLETKFKSGFYSRAAFDYFLKGICAASI